MQSARVQMPTESRLAAFCGAMIEAVWLSAICVVPLLLNPQSTEAAYQPVKYGFLRVLALLGALAWTVRAIELAKSDGGLIKKLSALSRCPWSILLLLFALIIAISTAFSVYPSVSFWGAYETFQGALTYGAELVIAALIVNCLRRNDQIERFVTLLLVTSFTVSIFAVLQRFGWDPRHPKIIGGRVFATAGHPIYLAGYLLMSAPLTLYRLLRLRARPQAGRNSTLGACFYLGLLAIQLVAFFCADSRGPILALGATLFTFAILYAAGRRWKFTLGIAGAVAALFIMTLIFGGTALKSLGNVPGLKRFALTTPKQGVEFFRAEIWKQAPRIIFARDPLPHPGGGFDRWPALRPWIGYGPETLDCVLPIHYTVLNNPDNVVENRFHNLVWDLWFSLGATGLVVFLALILWLFFRTYQQLGFIDAPGSVATFWVVSILSSGLGVASFVWIFGVGFAGVGLLGGLLAGLILVVCLSILLTPKQPGGQLAGSHILLLALLSAIAGHIVDTAFAFPSAPTAVLFWSYLGVAFALLRGAGDHADQLSQSSKSSRALSPTNSVSVLLPSMMISLGLVALLTSVLHQYAYQPFTIFDVLSKSLFQPGGDGNSHSLLLLVIIAFWLGASLAFALDANLAGGKGRFAGNLARTLLITGLIGVLYAVTRSGQIAAIGPFPNMAATESAVLKQGRGYDYLFLSGMAALSLLIVAIAWSLMRTSQKSFAPISKLGWTATTGALVVLFFAGREISFNLLRADVYAGWASALDGAKRSPLSPASYRAATAINPQPFIYRARLSFALIAKAGMIADPAVARTCFIEAERTLLAGREMNDLNRSSYYLGQLYLIWSEREDGAIRTELEMKAAKALREASAFEPHNEPVTTLAASVEKRLTDQPGDRVR